jgi:hypothetical protein
MPLSNEQKRQIIADLEINCPVRRWQERRGGSVAVHTRAGVKIWKPPAPKRKRTKKSGD